MTKVIAISLFAAVVLAATLDAGEPSTGTTLGEKTPNIANKHPDLHQALTDGTFDSMPFEQKIMFLHEPYFRDLVEFGLGADAVDTERAIDPVMRELCALPANDVRGRVRLMNVAARAEQAALDLATTRLLNRLTADGSSRLDALLQSNNRERTSVELDWEGIATDSPQTMDQVMAGVCDRYDLLVGIEEVLAKGRVALP